MTKALSNATAPAAKGDIAIGSGSNAAAILSVGTNNQVLTADSTQTTGVKWATPVSGSMTLLSTTALSGTSTIISGFSQSYINLMVLIQNPYGTSSSVAMYIRPNGSSSITDFAYVSGGGTAAGAALTQITAGTGTLVNTSNANWGFCLNIFNYSDTSYGKPFNYSGNIGSSQIIGGGQIESTGAITSITLLPASGSWGGGQVKLYGVN